MNELPLMFANEDTKERAELLYRGVKASWDNYGKRIFEARGAPYDSNSQILSSMIDHCVGVIHEQGSVDPGVVLFSLAQLFQELGYKLTLVELNGENDVH